MLVNNPNHTISFSIFSDFPELLCVMSTRKWGNRNVGIKPIENALPLLNPYKIPLKSFVSMRQRHSLNIAEVANAQGGTLIQNTDCLITGNTNLYLGVKAADCVPVFFYDPVKKIVAVAHAGWKGTLGRIAVNVIQKMQSSGSDPKNILVAIGPHIGGCCYDVLEERAVLFQKEFNNEKTVFQNEGKWYLDLGLVNKLQLIDSGIRPEHIDAPITCTSCQNDTYFSFRKEGPETFGEMLGIIGIKT